MWCFMFVGAAPERRNVVWLELARADPMGEGGRSSVGVAHFLHMERSRGRGDWLRGRRAGTHKVQDVNPAAPCVRTNRPSTK